MEWINYHHLLYFWTVAREGSIARACEKLRLAQPTISGQLRMLEESLGEKLFAKSGRGLAMTEVGQVVFRYADEIFGLGRELQDVLKGRPRGRPLRLLVGISDLVPKLVAYRVLAPVLAMGEQVQMVCDENTPDRLLADLAEHRLDVVLLDSPISANVKVKAYNHLLGSCGASVLGAASLAARYRHDFPKSLDGAPFLLPLEGSNLRRSIEHWFDEQHIRPKVVGEFQDSALMKTFGQAGAGLFFAPSAIEKEVRDLYKVSRVGRASSVVERYYAISIERKLKHPAVVTICDAARDKLFGPNAEA
jgi:LysR family transcriptional regulator, transcriptional activator of nhaA